MTLIAFAADRDAATIVTDTMAYAQNARHTSSTTKLILLPHLDAAVIGQGSTTFERQWRAEVLDARLRDFDDLNDQAPVMLQDLWARMAEQIDAENAELGSTAQMCNSIAFHVGYSRRDDAFKAYLYASDFDFRQDQVSGLHVMPSPLDVKPSDVELRRLQKHFRKNFDDTTPVRPLHFRPKPKVPTSRKEWVDLALRVREQRGLADIYSGFSTYVGGAVIHTHMTRGTVTQARAHTFDSEGEEFQQMMRGSLHPVGQNGPCGCGSGVRLVDCCLAYMADRPCPCGSGKGFRDCCRVPEPSESAGTDRRRIQAEEPATAAIAFEVA